MPKYRYPLSNGKTLLLEGDTEPSDAEVEQHAKEAGVTLKVSDEFMAHQAAVNKHLAEVSAKPLNAEKRTTSDNVRDFFMGIGTKHPSVPFSGGPDQIRRGLGDVLGGQFARGAHNVIGGAGTIVTPLLLPAAVAAPIPTAAALMGGTVGGVAGNKTALALGASPDQADLAGDVTGLASGAVAGGLSPNPSARTVLNLGRKATAGALDVGGAVLDNPIAGAMNPHYPHYGKMMRAGAEAIRPKTAANVPAGLRLAKVPKVNDTLVEALNEARQPGALTDPAEVASAAAPAGSDMTEAGRPSQSAAAYDALQQGVAGQPTTANLDEAAATAALAKRMEALQANPPRLVKKQAVEPFSSALADELNTPELESAGTTAPQPSLTPVKGRPSVSAADYDAGLVGPQTREINPPTPEPPKVVKPRPKPAMDMSLWGQPAEVGASGAEGSGLTPLEAQTLEEQLGREDLVRQLLSMDSFANMGTGTRKR